MLGRFVGAAALVLRGPGALSAARTDPACVDAWVEKADGEAAGGEVEGAAAARASTPVAARSEAFAVETTEGAGTWSRPAGCVARATDVRRTAGCGSDVVGQQALETG